jgi:GLPGLI family protein
MKRIFLLYCLSLFLPAAHAQETKFIVKGKIEFERKLNVHKVVSEWDGEFAAEMKKTIPQFKNDYFDYQFTGEKSIYKPGREETYAGPNFFDNTANTNIVYTDFVQQQFTSQKEVFEDRYLITDSLPKARWKITGEMRKIAGFDCRKAVGVFFDSVYVVAFYTDEIMVSGGPESFNGLPGMILGIAIPRMYTTWFATKVELETIKEAEIIPPVKGKKVNISTLKESLNKSLKDWGVWAQRNTWKVFF